MATSPDYCEPVVAWRVWHVVEEEGLPYLSSVYHQSLWPHRRALQADCRRTRIPLLSFRRPMHHAPAERCRCGIHAGFADGARDHLPNILLRPSAHPVIGRVSLWGDVVECERGWRASRAYPEQLYVPRLTPDDTACDAIARALAAYYGVPTEVLGEAAASDAVEEIMSAVDERAVRLGCTAPGAPAIPATRPLWFD